MIAPDIAYPISTLISIPIAHPISLGMIPRDHRGGANPPTRPDPYLSCRSTSLGPFRLVSSSLGGTESGR